MESRIADALKLRHQPVAILFTDERPQGAAQFKEDKWGCVISMLSAAARGITCVFDRKTTGCPGGRTGLCLGDGSLGRDLAGFLSTGGDGREGLRYFRSPEIAEAYLSGRTPLDIPETYVVFKPLAKVDGKTETPRLVVFLPSADQTAALYQLAHFDRPGDEAVTIPFGAGCQAICSLPYLETKRVRPRAVLGGMDVSARPWLDADLLTFTVPFDMFQVMEANVDASFLATETWGKLRERIR